MLSSIKSALLLILVLPFTLARLPPHGAAPAHMDFVYEAHHATPLTQLMTLVSISYPRLYTQDEVYVTRILEASYKTKCSISSLPDGTTALICSPDISQIKFFRVNCSIAQDPVNHTWVPTRCDDFPVGPAKSK